VKILLASSSHLGIDLLKHLQNSEHQLLGAISSPDQASGRGQSIGSNEFAAYCQRNDVVCYKPGSAQQLSEVLQQTQAELVITLAYGRLIKANELQMPKFGWLNVHFSLLPRWRGASPVQRAIAAGDRETGVTVFKLEEGLDTGPIYSTISYPLDSKSRSDEVLTHLASLSIKPVNEALRMIENNQSPTAQSGDGVTLAPKILKSEGRIDWSKDSKEIEARIRAFHPWPGAYTLIDGKRIGVIEGQVRDNKGAAGEIISLEPLIVASGSSALEILRVKPENKKEMSSSEWLRGARISLPCAFE